MKKLSTFLATALLATGALAAVPTDLGTGPGNYSLAGNKNLVSFKLTLGPGVYTAKYVVNALDQTTFDHVWLSLSNNNSWTNPNDLEGGLFNGNTLARDKITRTLTNTTTFYLLVDTTKSANDGFAGLLTVTAVPEPASSALFLAGLGVVGLAARRRQKRA
jgi:PEP-CTERM motif